MTMTREMAIALIEGAETGHLPMVGEAMVEREDLRVRTVGIEVAPIMVMALYQILELIEEAALIMAELQALSMIDIKGNFSFLVFAIFIFIVFMLWFFI